MNSQVKHESYVVSQEDKEEKAGKPKNNSKYLIIGVLLVAALGAAISALAVAIGIGVGVPASQKTTSEQTATSGLIAITITPEELAGEYHGSDGGIQFQSTVNSTHIVVSITTTNGEPVVIIIHPLFSNMTMMGVNDTNFMVMENQPGRPRYDDYVIPKDSMDTMASILMGQEDMTNEVLQQLDNKTINETRQSVLSSLALSQEALLIIEAAQALGYFGVQGSEYPAVMRFYILALRLANARDDAENNGLTLNSKLLNQPRPRRATRCSTGSTCYVCPYGSRCFGMCGKGCDCWWWVCGDCCVHEFCLTHDQCCANRGFWSWECQSAAWKWWFSCSDHYDC